MTIDEYLDPMSNEELRPLLAAAAIWWDQTFDNPATFPTADFWAAVGSTALKLLEERGVVTREEALQEIAGLVVHVDQLSKRLEEE